MAETETFGDYPPAHHVLRDLALVVEQREGRLRVTAPVGPALLDASGAVRCGVLGVAIDVFGGNHAIFEAAPDWALTSTLAVQRLRACGRGTLVVTGQALRSGRTQLVVEAEVHDADARSPHAVGRLTFTRVPRRADTPAAPAAPQARVAFASRAADLDAPFLDALGARCVDPDAGGVALDVSPYVRNSVGGLQGGVVVALVEASAEAAARARGLGPAVLDVEVQYLALARVGPIRSRARCLRDSGGTALWRVEVLDTGQEDRLTSVASVLTGPLPAA